MHQQMRMEASEKFYANLQVAVCRVPKQDMMLIIGILMQGLGATIQHDRGLLVEMVLVRRMQMALDFCTVNRLVITNAVFKHRPCHQHTWFQPAQESLTGHVLDYILVNHHFRSSVLDTGINRKTDPVDSLYLQLHLS